MKSTWITRGFTFSILLLVSACFSDDSVTPKEQLQIDLDNVDKDQLAIDVEIIDNYLAADSVEAIADPTGLRYVIHVEGEGISPQLEDLIRVKYIGTLLGEEEVFDSRNDVAFPLNDVIIGWKVGFQLLQVGDSATLYIPSGLAYGENGNGPIPPNANLVFGVKLIDVQRF
jgi:FKBP-type peptidyl-prolyl cis-trans isomerase